MIYRATYSSPLGNLYLTSDGQALTGLWFRDPAISPDICVHSPELPVFCLTYAWLDAYFLKQKPNPQNLPLAPRGTPFQQSVWQILLRIPWGQTRTYGDIAREMAVLTGKARMSPQAIGGAVGRNPISIIIPCHRVIGAGGTLTGYAGGLENKIHLLAHEGHHIQGGIL